MSPTHMRRTCLLLSGFLLTTVIAFSQQKSNPKIGKNETEISSFILADDYLAFGAQGVYRLSVVKKLKAGAGLLFGANGADDLQTFSGYAAVFADAIWFLGNREKWSFEGQLGDGICNHELYSGVRLKAGMYYSLSCNYRAIISKKMLFTTSLAIGKRNFHYEHEEKIPGNSGFLGLRFGIVF